MNLLFFFTFLLSITNSNSQYIVNHNLTVHYDTLYSNNYRFTNALNETYIIDQNTNNTYDCKYDCSNIKDCLGIYENYDNDYYCNLLSNIEGNKKVTENSNSILKINHWMYTLENHSISGVIWDSNTFSNNKPIMNVTLYLDINHNGILDIDEPWIIGNNKEKFVFDNITAGTYLVRQNLANNCVQFYPGINGSFMIGDNNIKGDGYIDNIIRYKHHGHSYGGYVNNSHYKIKNNNFSFIIANDSSTFMSFYPNNSLEAIFIDESIINKDGYDLVIDILETNSSTEANISVSHDKQNFKYLGLLNSSIKFNMYDLQDINYELPVNYIKLDFFGKNFDEALNIIRIGAYNSSIYLPSFAYNINVPKKELILFINDCHYDLSCNTYCDFNLLNEDDYNSCAEGCSIFEETNACNCSNQLWLNDDYVFKHDLCIHGCEYGIQQHIFPNYTLIPNYNGLSESIINSNNTCDLNCLDKLVDNCNSMNECHSISYSENNIIGNLFDNYKNSFEKNSFFMVKNNYFDTTSTTTTSLTSTTTTSLTSTTTTSLTSTTTTSLTSTTTTSLTSTTTTSLTSTTTTSLTSTTTTSLTSTTTTSLTSTTTTKNNIIVNNVNTNNVIDKPYRIIIIIIGSICSLLILVMFITLINKCIKKKLPIQNHLSIHNPVYEPDFENESQIQEPSLYNNLDPTYKCDTLTGEYLEIVRD